MNFLQTQMQRLDELRARASQVRSLPILRRWSPPPPAAATTEHCEGFLNSQRLALQACREVASFLQPGWSEKQAAAMVNTYLRDHGVQSFFHYAFAWYGERTRFEGVRTYWDYLPSSRILQEGEVFILDVAPIVDGFVSDVGFSGCMGDDPEFARAMDLLRQLRSEIPAMVDQSAPGRELWQAVNQRLLGSGFTNIHRQYPFAVLGHRVHQVPASGPDLRFLNFGWRSYWSLLSRGLFGQLLNADFQGDLRGLWAIEPHLGTQKFGAKFEEILVIDDAGAHWLEAATQLGSLD